MLFDKCDQARQGCGIGQADISICEDEKACVRPTQAMHKLVPGPGFAALLQIQNLNGRDGARCAYRRLCCNNRLVGTPVSQHKDAERVSNVAY